MDGFDQTVNVKVIMATNRADTLDPALLRPGRLDRKIEFPLPDRRQKRLVFQVCNYYALSPFSMYCLRYPVISIWQLFFKGRSSRMNWVVFVKLVLLGRIVHHVECSG